ncbi:MAG: hypothetical protein IJ772_05345 [Bacilli bacterium]|nr:hypothetical protein [Bacilli bacterium]
MVETKEQEKEQISENPVAEQDTASVNSQSTSEAEVTEAQRSEGEVENTTSEASIEPEIVDAKNASHVESPEDIAKREGDPDEMPLDLSKIEKDEEGFPIISRIDIDRIKKSGLAVTDFEAEIALAHDAFKAAKLELDTQDEHEKEFNKRIDELKKTLETAEENKKEEIQKQIDDLIELKNTLPKYNPEIKRELEKQMLNSVKAAAVYQNVSRNTLDKLFQDGTIGALISSTANSVFASAYADAKLKGKGQFGLYDSETIREYKNKIAKNEDEYTRLEYMYDSLKIVEDKEKQKRIGDYIASAKDNKEKTDFITKILTCLNKISRPDIFPNAAIKQAGEEYSKIKLDTMVIEDENVKELDDVKEEERKREQFVDDIEEYTTAMCAIGFAYQMMNINRAENKDPRTIKVPTLMNFNINSFTFGEVWDKSFKYYHERYDKRYQELKEIDESYSDKIESEIIARSEEYRNILHKEGLANGVIEYAFHVDSTRNYYASTKSVFHVENAMINSDAYINMIKILGITDDSSEQEFQTVKMNINVATLLGNNFIHYMEMLMNPKTFKADWANSFDPESEIKEWYKENKKLVEDLMKEYHKVRDDLSHFLFFSSIISENYATLVEKIVDYLESVKYKAQKINEGKSIKSKYATITKISFLQNFPLTFTKFLAEIEKISPQIEEKRKEFEGKSEEFNKWYDTEMHEKELEVTHPVIEEVIHSTFGIGLLKAFLDYKEHFMSRNKNELLSRDITKYIFHEFTLSSLATRCAKNTETLGDYIKAKSKSTTFRSVNYEFEKDVIPEDARKAFAINIIRSITNIFKGILLESNEEAKAKAEKEAKRLAKEQEKANKPKKLSREEQRHLESQRRKELKKKRRAVEDRIWDLEKQYSSFINNAPVVSNTDILKKTEGNYFVEVIPDKDTRVKVKVLFTRKDYSKDNITNLKDFFSKEGTVLSKEEPLSVSKAFNVTSRITSDKYINLGEKWYYNQFVDSSFVKDENGNNLTANELNKMTRSQICRFVVNSVLTSDSKFIFDKIKEHIITSGVMFEEKNISIKDNTKFDIKYFNGSKMSDYIRNLNDNGNLNFFANNNWVLLTFEINYDLVNIEKKEDKKEETENKTPTKEYKPINHRAKAFENSFKKGRTRYYDDYGRKIENNKDKRR